MDTLAENWLLIGDEYYMKYHFYNMSWDLEDLKNYIVAHEPYGGSIAVIARNVAGQYLYVFSASGKLQSHMEWLDAPVIGLGWSEDECIFLLQKSGRIAIRDLHCSHLGYRKMGDEVLNQEVKTFRFFATHEGTGLALITEKNELFYRTNLMNTSSSIVRIPNTKQFFKNDSSNCPVSDWLPLTNQNGSVIILAGYKNQIVEFENDLRSLKSTCHQTVHGSNMAWDNAGAAQISKLALSPSHQHLAVLFSDGNLWLLKTNDLSCVLAHNHFSQLQVGSNQSELELQMEWAGEDMCVVYYQDNLFMLDTTHQFTERLYLELPILFPEIDGVRIITASKHEFLQKIPSELEQLYTIDSQSPAVWLFDAQQHLESGSYETVRFIDNIRNDLDQLRRAVDCCLTAASYCLEPRWQKTILKAARLGRCFVPDYKSDRAADIHSKLVLLNNLKLPFAAMPLTLVQLNQLTLPVLLDRLIHRGYYPLVERLCGRLRIPREIGIDRMLIRWAELAVDSICKEEDKTRSGGSSMADTSEQLKVLELITRRLKQHRGFDYARIAQRAVAKKKMLLAEKLLEKEVRVDRQVRIFLDMKKYNTALQRSTESGNSELISFVVSQLYKKLPQEDLQLLVDKNPVAKTMLIELVLTPGELEDFQGNMAAGRRTDVDNVTKSENLLKDLVQSPNIQTSLSSIPLAKEIYKKCNSDFMVHILEDQKTLLAHMQSTNSSSSAVRQPHQSMSLHDYLGWLYDNGLDVKADSLCQQLKVPNKTGCYLKLQSCARTGAWSDFQTIVNSSSSSGSKWSQKALVGFNDIVELCVEYGNEELFHRFCDKVDPEKRVRLLVKLGRFQEANDLARSLENDFLINYVAAIKFTIT